MNKYNNEGYPDPTAYYGMKEIVKEESEQERKNQTPDAHYQGSCTPGRI